MGLHILFLLAQEGSHEMGFAHPKYTPHFLFETPSAPNWCGDVRLCRTRLNPHFLFVLPKRLPGFPAELYRFGTEKPGGYSLLKRECPPSPLKRNVGGVSISPPPPLKRHKGAKLRFLPFGNPSWGWGSGSEKRSRGCPICTPRLHVTISTAYKT